MQAGELLPSDDFIFSANQTTPGRIDIALAGAAGIGAARGRLLTLTFLVKSGALAGDYTIALADATLFDTVGAIVELITHESTVTITGEREVFPEGSIFMDFNLAAGDQEQRIAGNARTGMSYEVQLIIKDSPEIKGWDAIIEYDPGQVRYMPNSFQASDFIPGLNELELAEEGKVDVGGTILGFEAKNSGDGTLGTLSFEISEGFSGSTDLVITEIGINRVSRGEERRKVRSIATITSESMASRILGDFNGSGRVDFSDFFLFADHFGGTDPLFDFNGSGRVDFSDFFLFADNFGKEDRAKLIVLAQKYISLSLTPRLEPNYPNPFNASTTIRYQVAEGGVVALEVFDLNGQRVRSLVDESKGPGVYEVVWDGTNEAGQSVSSGMYLARLWVGEWREVRKMVMVK